MNANGKNETILPGIFTREDKIFSKAVSMLTYQLHIRIPLMPREGVIWPGTLQDPYQKKNTKITFILLVNPTLVSYAQIKLWSSHF